MKCCALLYLCNALVIWQPYSGGVAPFVRRASGECQSGGNSHTVYQEQIDPCISDELIVASISHLFLILSCYTLYNINYILPCSYFYSFRIL